MWYFILFVVVAVLIVNAIFNIKFLSMYKDAEKEADRLREEDRKAFREKMDKMNK